MSAGERTVRTAQGQAPASPGSVRARILAVADALPPAERRVAELVLADPRAVAFGTVAEVAAGASASGPTVVRFAGRLGLSGFGELQDHVRDELGERLRPAAERIRDRPVHDTLGRVLDADVANVRTTLEGVDAEGYRRTVALLSARSRRIAVVSGDASYGIAHQFASDLGTVRGGVELVAGAESRVLRTVALLDPGDVVVAIELRRYERWVLTAIDLAGTVGARVVAVTDSAISPVAVGAEMTFVVAAAGPGPFDSHAGTLALTNALVAGTAARLRRSATERLDRVERAWGDAETLID